MEDSKQDSLKKILKGVHYQPIILEEQAWQSFKKGKFTIPKNWYIGGERQCFDRIEAIAKDIKQPGTVLDIGSNIGFFSHVLTSLGSIATGIENDYHVEVKKLTEISSLKVARKLNEFYGLNTEFIGGDFIHYLEKTKRTWDYTLFLSLFHHFLIGYGSSEKEKLAPERAIEVLQLVDEHTDKVMYFEMDDNIGKDFGWSLKEIANNLRRYTNFDLIEELKVSTDGWAKARVIYRCSRSKASKGRDRGKPVVLSYSRNNNIGYKKDGSLFVTREANDWNAKDHIYNFDVKRQKALKAGKVLEILKNNPHPNVCQIKKIENDWLEIEFIEGELLSTKTPYLHSDHKNADYLDSKINIFEGLRIITLLKEGLEFLHRLGVAHTDPTAFNAMVDKNKNPKWIDLTGCVPLTLALKKLDYEVFSRFLVQEVLDRINYEYCKIDINEVIADEFLNNVENEKLMMADSPRKTLKTLAFYKEKIEQTTAKSLDQTNEHYRQIIENLNAQILEKDKLIHDIINSKGWKVLEKLRTVRNKIRN